MPQPDGETRNYELIGAGLDMEQYFHYAHRQAKFRRIVKKAMIAERLIDIDDQADFIKWALGPDFKDVPPQEWPDRIRDRVHLVGIDEMTSVFAVIRAAAQIWHHKRIMVRMN